MLRSAFPYSVSFFFQAEDGIRDWSVTGVQTCALPILIPANVFDDIALAESDIIIHDEFSWLNSHIFVV